MSEENKIESTEENQEASGRGRRKKVGASEVGSGRRISYRERNKLSTSNRDDNYHYRVVNHDDGKWAGRVDKMKQIGYVLANDEESIGEKGGVKASSLGSVKSTPVGNGTVGVLMKIRKEHYEEDFQQKQAEVDLTEIDMVDENLRAGGNDLYGDGLKVDRSKPTFNVQK